MRRLDRWALGLLAVFSALRFWHWGAALTGDEGYMLRYYVSQPFSYIATHYEVPNNHVLLSLLLKLINELSPWELIESLADPRALQAPSILASIGALFLFHRFAAGLLGPRGALLAATALGLSFWHLLYSHMLRGYSLSAFFNLAALWLAERARGGRKRELYLLPWALLAAHYLVPANFLFTAGLAAWIALRWGVSRETAPVGAAIGAGVSLSVLSYLPIGRAVLDAKFTQVHQKTIGAALAATGPRLEEFVKIGGVDPWFRAVFFGFCLLGLAALLRGGRRRARLGLAAAAYLLAPLVLTTVQMTVAPSRVFVSALPMLALLFGAGAAAAADRAGLPAGAALALAGLLSAGELGAFLNWKRGVDERILMKELVAATEGIDDYAVILTFPKDRTAADMDSSYWQHYGQVTGRQTYERLLEGADFPYLVRSRTLIAASGREEALIAAERGGIDPLQRAAMRERGVVGRVRLFEMSLDDPALAAGYEAAARSGRGAARVSALTALGARAMKRGDLAGAVRLLEQAKALAPEDRKARFQLALARYLTLDDHAAHAELEWVVRRDPANLHARLYYADALAGIGRTEEALRAYAACQSAPEAAALWTIQERARWASESLRRRDAQPVGALSRASSWQALAVNYRAMGSLERAAIAAQQAVALEPTDERVRLLAVIEAQAHNYSRSCALLRELRRQVSDPAVAYLLAETLLMKFSVQEARDQLPALSAQADHPKVVELRRRLSRL